MTRVAVVRWLVAAAAAVCVVLALEHWVAALYRLSSASMEPTLHCARGTPNCLGGAADVVLANRLVYRLRNPRRGEVVVVQLPQAAARKCGAEATVIKRVIGLPGESVSERDGVVSIDGRPLREPYVDLFHDDHDPQASWHVPAGGYFLMGDNRGESCDSRTVGALPRDDIKAKVAGVVWPPGRIHFGL
jgi:signal peptidase I